MGENGNVINFEISDSPIRMGRYLINPDCNDVEVIRYDDGSTDIHDGNMIKHFSHNMCVNIYEYLD